jgi:hypothetical protein
VASSRSDLDLDQPERRPQIPSSIKKTGYAAGHLGTQGKRRWKNAEGKYECRECRKEHGEKRDYVSTEGLRKHERKCHNRPEEGQEKLSSTDKEGDELFKPLEVKIRKVQKQNRKMAKELGKAVKLLREVKKSMS